jgi:competence protein ComEA
VLLSIVAVLLGWHVYASSRWATRPATLEHDALRTSRVDLNRADRAQLLQLPGVGEARAERIVAYREQHGNFHSVDELRQVQGIGPSLIEKLRPLVYVESVDGEEESDAHEEPRPAKPAGTPNRMAKPPMGNKPAQSKKASELAGPIDVNRASAEELQRLPGIGPALSDRMIAMRQKSPFKKVEDLRRVRGIGPKTLENLRPFVVVGEPEPEKKD